MQLLTVTKELDRLQAENIGLQAQVDRLTKRFQPMWPTIIEANTEALADTYAYSLIGCCDHIQTACICLATTNEEMKKEIEIVRSTLPNPMEIHPCSFESKM